MVVMPATVIVAVLRVRVAPMSTVRFPRTVRVALELNVVVTLLVTVTF